MRRTILLIMLLAASPFASAACPALLDLKLPTLSEDAASLCRYEGKVLLVVNTASECGYTPQDEGLDKLYRRFKDKTPAVRRTREALPPLQGQGPRRRRLSIERSRRTGAGLEPGDRPLLRSELRRFFSAVRAIIGGAGSCDSLL